LLFPIYRSMRQPMPTARRQYILMTRHLSSLRFRLIVRILLAVIAAAELTQVSAARYGSKVTSAENAQSPRLASESQKTSSLSCGANSA
jgi:hypothetical protein